MYLLLTMDHSINTCLLAIRIYILCMYYIQLCMIPNCMYR